MSFALTTQQVRDMTKDVTRRLGWWFLNPGDMVCAIVKGQGLKQGERVERLGFLRVVDVRREPLLRMLMEPAYGRREVWREGFACADDRAADHDGLPATCDACVRAFVAMFQETHKGVDQYTPLTRIEFVYQNPWLEVARDSYVVHRAVWRDAEPELADTRCGLGPFGKESTMFDVARARRFCRRCTDAARREVPEVRFA